MTKAHKNAEVIKAWADGKVIQWLNLWPNMPGEWEDFDEIKHLGPWCNKSIVWRIKPEPKKGWVRVAEHGENGVVWTSSWSAYDEKSEAEIEARLDFIRWLSPRFDFEYPEDYKGV